MTEMTITQQVITIAMCVLGTMILSETESNSSISEEIIMIVIPLSTISRISL